MYTHSRYNITFNGESIENANIYTYQSEELAKLNSMNYSICRVDVNDKWIYYYRGKRVDINIISLGY